MRAGGFTGESTHYGREAVTDILLGLLQDTGWCATPQTAGFRVLQRSYML